jgi:hypothetical protein
MVTISVCKQEANARHPHACFEFSLGLHFVHDNLLINKFL